MSAQDLTRVMRGLAHGGFMLFVGEFLSTTLLALAAILMARLLGPSGYGLYTLALVIPSLTVNLIGLGVDFAAARFPAKFRSESKPGAAVAILRSIVLLRSLIALVISLTYLAFTDWLASIALNRPDASGYLRLSLVFMVFQAVWSLLYYAFTGLDEAEKSALVRISAASIKVVAAPLLIVLGYGVTGAIIGHYLGITLATIAGTILLVKSCRKLRLKAVKESYGESSLRQGLKLVLSYGLPLYLATAITTLISQLRFIFLAYNVSDGDIGGFQAALNFQALFLVFLTPIITSLLPAFSKLGSNDEDHGIDLLFNLSVRYSALLMVPLSVAVMILSPQLMEIIYGHEYLWAATYLTLYVVIFLYVGLGYGVLGSLFNGVGETGLTLRLNLVNLLVFLPSAYALTPRLGAVGLLVSILISNLISSIYGLFMAWKKLGIRLRVRGLYKIYLSAFMASIPTIPISRFIKLPSPMILIAGGAAYLIAYFMALTILKSVSRTDLESLERVFSGTPLISSMIRFLARIELRLLKILYGRESR
mgnify:CR=1 FL=1